MKFLNRLLYIKRSKTFPQVGSRDTLNIAVASTSSAKISLYDKNNTFTHSNSVRAVLEIF